jgi:MFS family permease
MSDIFEKLGSLNRYQWWVLVVAALGWLFDTMDQRLFILAREPALKEVMAVDLPSNPTPTQQKAWDAQVSTYSGLVTAIFMVGWATGGLFFGVIGDKWGRVFTMLLTILIYSLFTGLSAFSVSWWDFAIYRFLAGVGVGGEFAAGVALVAEVMPDDARPYALGLLQALSAVGNIIGSTVSFYVTPLSFTIAAGTLGFEQDFVVHGWRMLFFVGIFPALLIIFVRRQLEEPESWQQAQADQNKADEVSGEPKKQLGSIAELLGDPHLRWHVFLGIALSLSGVIGLWGIGFYTPELLSQEVFKNEAPEAVARWRAIMTGLQDVGGFFGILAFSVISGYLGRRPAFAITFIMALAATLIVFGTLREAWQIWWMAPMIGFCNLAVFGGYAIYFPELFPTRLRSTGTGFCYNVSRYIAAAGPIMLGTLKASYLSAGFTEPLRAAGMTVAMIYLLGLLVLPFAPETKDRPLPE